MGIELHKNYLFLPVECIGPALRGKAGQVVKIIARGSCPACWCCEFPDGSHHVLYSEELSMIQNEERFYWTNAPAVTEGDTVIAIDVEGKSSHYLRHGVSYRVDRVEAIGGYIRVSKLDPLSNEWRQVPGAWRIERFRK